MTLDRTLINTELKSKKTILGLSIRTNPENAGRDISALWQRFMQENMPTKMGHPDAPIFSVYCDYESDHTGAYTTVLGYEVSPTTLTPQGMHRVELPAGPYACFSVKGQPGKVVYDAWTSIWANNELTQRRSYVADFECYKRVSSDEVEAEIWVGAK